MDLVVNGADVTTDGPLSGAPDEAGQLAGLRWHWDTTYEINLSGDTWTARYLTGTETLSAATADELRRLIRTDYQARKRASAPDDAPTASREGETGAA